MTKITAAITAVGGHVPDYVLTNEELSTMVDTNDEWIRTRTGIHERRILRGKDKGVSDLALPAVQEILDKKNLDPKEIELIIFATTSKDHVFPATANIVGNAIGAVNSFGFDLEAACSGFLYALSTGAKFIESGTHRKVLVIGSDKMSAIIDYEDRATCVIFGDGAGAVLLEPNEEGYGLQDSFLRSDGGGCTHLKMISGGSKSPATVRSVRNHEHFVYQEGRQVFKHAVTNMEDACRKVMDKNNLTADDIRFLVPHQANTRIIDVVSKAVGIPEEKVMKNIHKYGNTTAATLPLCLHDYESQLKKGDKLILTTFGGGFTWGATYLTWAY